MSRDGTERAKVTFTLSVLLKSLQKEITYEPLASLK